MTIDEQIAERLGWRIDPDLEDGAIMCHDDKGNWDMLPAWSESYDAIHRDLLPRLTESQRFDFVVALNRIAVKEGELTSFSKMYWDVLSATPVQLCEAWLEATKDSR